MITNTEIRNALTGALAIMALGLFASCSETPVAPMDDGRAVHAPAADSTQLSLQSCTMVDGVWVCGSGGAPPPRRVAPTWSIAGRSVGSCIVPQTV
jgi:hypothetical protein